MAYEELTCDDVNIPLEELFRGAMVHLPDGSWMLQTVDITGGGGGGGDFNDDFSDDFNI